MRSAGTPNKAPKRAPAATNSSFSHALSSPTTMAYASSADSASVAHTHTRASVWCALYAAAHANLPTGAGSAPSTFSCSPRTVRAARKAVARSPKRMSKTYRNVR